MKTTLTVTKQEEGLTIKELFCRLEYSTLRIKRLKYTDNGILVNGERKRVRYVLKEGDKVELTTPDNFIEPYEYSATAKVLFQDKYLYVAEKDENTPSHPDRVHRTDTLGHQLAKYFGSEFELHVITRLDLTTSGVVLGAFDEVTAEKLNAMQTNHQIHKTYFAVTENTPPHLQGEIDLPLSLGQDKTVVDFENGKPSKTLYEVVKTSEKGTLVKLTPLTGRTHQLRAHLAEIGCPLKGDVRYGGKQSDRIYLHAQRITFTHPVTGETVDMTSELPFDV